MRDPAKENTLALADTDIRGKDTAGGPDYSLSYPHNRSRDQPSIRGHPREANWTVTHRNVKDANS